MTGKSSEEKVMEAHMKHLNERLDRFDDLFEKLFDRQDNMSKILERNTVIVDEHQKRSTHLERIVSALKDALEALSRKFTFLEKDLESLQSEFKPVKDHVKEVSSIFHLFSWMPKILQGTILLLTLLSAVYGVVAVVREAKIDVPKALDNLDRIK